MKIFPVALLFLSASGAGAVSTVAPAVFIDVPTANSALTGTSTISGWAIENTSSVGPYAVNAGAVFVDGSQVGTATYGVARPDVCAAFPGRLACPNVGWNYNLNVAAFTAGSHTLKIVATDTAGNSSFSQVTFTAGAQVQPSVFIDAPTANATLAGTTTIGGWAIENTSSAGPYAVNAVTVLVDGSQVGTATYGAARPDVCAAFPGRLACPNVGWNYNLNVAALTAGSHTLKIVATDTAGNSSFSQVTFTAAAQVQPSVFIDAPTANATLAGTTTIGGWAIENTSVVGPYAISTVTVFVDGSQVGTATYGAARPDVCAAFPGRLACPNVGWNYNLNVAALTAGSHTLKIVATDTAGNSNFSAVTISTPASQLTTYSISGTVTGSAATLTLSGVSSQTVTTNSPGNYSFSGLANGSYVVAASQPGYAFTPTTAAVVISGSSDAGVNFSAAPAPHSVSLSWAPSTSAGVAGYNVYRGTVSGGPYTKVTPSLMTGSAYNDTAVTAGTTYFYVVTTVNTSNQESGYSNMATGTVPIP